MQNPLPCLLLAVSSFLCLNAALGACLQNLGRQVTPESPQVFWVKHLTCIATSVPQENMVEGEDALVSISMAALEGKQST